MDATTISTTVSDAWTILQPYLPIIATKTAEKVGAELPAAVGKVWGALKAKFDNKQAAKEALTDLLKSPGDSDLQAVFRVQVKKILEEDSVFAEEFNSLVKEAGTQINVRVRDGAAAIGDHAKAVGKGGTLIEGSVGGDYIE
jgi:hypothetical protein